MPLQEIIVGIMREQGVTQNKLAERMGISRQAMSQMLKGQDMKVSTAIDILSVLGYTLTVTKDGEEDE